MRTLLLSLLLVACPALASDDEVSLFDSKGKATAYIALDDEMTIFLWNGSPVAYLERDGSGDYDVYGFNGSHLGWFVDGVIRDHRGDVACATKGVMQYTEYEPFKAFRQFTPFKAFAEFAPFQPSFSNSFSQIPCQLLLAKGAT